MKLNLNIIYEFLDFIHAILGIFYLPALSDRGYSLFLGYSSRHGKRSSPTPLSAEANSFESGRFCVVEESHEVDNLATQHGF
jgi:hypothetical protein